MGRASNERYDCGGRANGLAELPDRDLHISDYRDDPPTGTNPEASGSNYPTVLLPNGRGAEQLGKREDERSLSGVYARAERK